MTAIVALATGDLAFVAADTRRVAPGWGTLTARKVHRWSETVLFAQCGDGIGVTDLICEMTKIQANAYAANPGVADDEVLVKAFKARHSAAYGTAVTRVAHLASGAKHISGAILVAAAADAFGPARLHRLDFKHGTARRLACSIRAEGSSPREYTRLARSLMPASGTTGLQLDHWGERCIAGAIATHPKAVGWPVDLLLSRSSPTGSRYLVERRLAAPGSPHLPEFLV